MRASAPSIIPIFRSDLQADVLAILYERPGVESTVLGLADRLGRPLSTVAREVHRLVASDLLVARHIGRSKLVTANWNLRWADALSTMLAHTVGLPARITAALDEVPGIESALIFGSWAARFAGEAGPEPNDIDVLIVGDVDFGDIRAALRNVESELGNGLVINPTILSSAQWAEGSPFVETVRSRPTFELVAAA